MRARVVPGLSFQVWPCRVGVGILRELRRQNSEEQHDRDGTQNDPMFLHGWFSFFGPQTRRTFSILIGQSSACLAYCLIDAVAAQVPNCGPATVKHFVDLCDKNT